MNQATQWTRAFRTFHRDERGLEALQTVMILAIAGVALVLVKDKWDGIKTFFKTGMDQIVQTNFTT